MDLSRVPLEDYPILGLFSRVLTETGTSKLDRVQLSRRIGSQTGGVYASFLTDQPSAGGSVADPGALKSYLFLRGKVNGRKYAVASVLLVFLLSGILGACTRLVFSHTQNVCLLRQRSPYRQYGLCRHKPELPMFLSTFGTVTIFYGCSPALHKTRASVAESRLWLILQAVTDKVPEMLNIMYDVMTDAKLDSQQRVVEMLKESKVQHERLPS